ncbi:MAG: (2Fe-2S) ferredoxin domain-containing protein [Pyrinomonadaceae bacterium]|nr:(2Fe-2S) ferredoxin domain-containing protein [Pyrinomonadaceae bacterium]
MSVDGICKVVKMRANAVSNIGSLLKFVVSKLKKIKSQLLVCAHKTCLKQGGKSTRKELKRALKERELRECVLITKVDCLDQCGRGPVVVVYPDGVWYGGVDEKRARAIVEKHFDKAKDWKELKVLHDMQGEGKAK